VQPLDEINEMGFDLAVRPCVRTSMSCVRRSRCEQSAMTKARRCARGQQLPRRHAPSGPAYKFKFKFSGCPNDCVNRSRSTWPPSAPGRQHQTDDVVARSVARRMDELVNDVISRCPKALSLRIPGRFKAEGVSSVDLTTPVMEIENPAACAACTASTS